MEIFMVDEIVAPAPQEQVAPVEQAIDPSAPLIEDEQKEVVPEKPKEEPIPKGVQKRIDRAVRQKYEAEARANELERRLQHLEQNHQAKPATSDAPKYEDFQDFDAYSRAVARYEAKQEIESTLNAHQKVEAERKAQAAQAATAETWAKRAAAARAEMPDFDEVVSSSDITLFKDPSVSQAIIESNIGPQIAYYLASNPDEADEIADMTGFAAIRAIGRLEAKLEGGKASVTKTPAPIKPVGQRASAEKSPNDMTNEEFAKWRRKIIAQRGSR